MARIVLGLYVFCLLLGSPALGMASWASAFAADAAPTPSVNGCAAPGAPARIVDKHAMPVIPERVLTEGAASYAVRVRIQLSKDGIASNPQLVKRSGNLEIDALALQSATAMRYTPEFIDCEPIAGPYDLQFSFDLRPRSGDSGSQSSLNQVTILAPPCPGDHGPILLSAPRIPRVGVKHGRRLSAIAIALYVDKTGRVASTRVIRSSGDKTVDAKIASAAAHAGFQPAVHACRTAAGVYMLQANFRAQD